MGDVQLLCTDKARQVAKGLALGGELALDACTSIIVIIIITACLATWPLRRESWASRLTKRAGRESGCHCCRRQRKGLSCGG